MGLAGAFDHSKRAPTDASKSTFVETYLGEFCPEGANSPAGEEWIRPFTYRRVRRKLGDKFGAAEHAFYALDDDDSGSLTRAEVGTGLQTVGIRLNPQELSEFVDQLDLDGGGKIEVEEVGGAPPRVHLRHFTGKLRAGFCAARVCCLLRHGQALPLTRAAITRITHHASRVAHHASRIMPARRLLGKICNRGLRLAATGPGTRVCTLLPGQRRLDTNSDLCLGARRPLITE